MLTCTVHNRNRMDISANKSMEKNEENLNGCAATLRPAHFKVEDVRGVHGPVGVRRHETLIERKRMA